MPKYLKILIPAISICFVFGVYWGFKLKDSQKSPLGDLRILAPNNSFSKEFIKTFEQTYGVKVYITSLNLFKHNLEVKTKFKNYDIVWLDYLLAKSIEDLYNLEKLPSSIVTKVSPDFSYLISSKNIVLPYRWKTYFFQTENKNSYSLAQFKKEKYINYNFNSSELNTLVTMNYFALLRKKWFYEENLESVKRAIKKLLRRTNVKNKKAVQIRLSTVYSPKNSLGFKKNYLEINFLALPKNNNNKVSKLLFLKHLAENPALPLFGTSYGSTFTSSNTEQVLSPEQRSSFVNEIDLSKTTKILEILPTEKIWSQAYLEAKKELGK